MVTLIISYIFIFSSDISTYQTPQFLLLLLRYQSKRLSPYFMITVVFGCFFLLIPYIFPEFFIFQRFILSAHFLRRPLPPFQNVFPVWSPMMSTNPLILNKTSNYLSENCQIFNNMTKICILGFRILCDSKFLRTHLSSGISSLARLKLLQSLLIRGPSIYLGLANFNRDFKDVNQLHIKRTKVYFGSN